VTIDRRKFMYFAGGAAVRGIAGKAAASTPIPKRGQIRAVAFDAFPIFNPGPIATRAEELFPGRGTRLVETWRQRQFEYTWLRTAARHYVDFWQVTDQALTFAATNLKLKWGASQREALLSCYRRLEAWPDVSPALERLRQAGVRLVFLSNFTNQMLEDAVRSSGLQGYFEAHLSTDRVREFKPAPRAYAMAMEAFGMRREEITFVASAEWDAAGAKWFGYPTVWINRAEADVEALEVKPDLIAPSLDDLTKFILNGA
jgi:2-haloacid dehalogenase